MASYHFNVESFKISNTRALHNDTDAVCAWVRVGGAIVNKPTCVKMGDVNNGVHVANAKVGPFHIADDNTPVVFGYQIVNAGHSNWGDVASTLTRSAEALSLAVVPEPFGAGVAAALELFNQIKSIFTANCDGVVALEQRNWDGKRVRELTAQHGHIELTHTHHGTDSSTGCGSNSLYSVTYRLSVTA